MVAVTDLDTRGLVYADISGSNFGPSWPRAFVTAVTFGGYTVGGCTMTQEHKRLRCPFIPGVGTSLRWQVWWLDSYFSVHLRSCRHCLAQIEVLGQMALSTQTFSYGAPVLLSTSPTTIPTLGITVGVMGSNFGYEPSKIVVVLNGVPVSGFTIQVLVVVGLWFVVKLQTAVTDVTCSCDRHHTQRWVLLFQRSRAKQQ